MTTAARTGADRSASPRWSPPGWDAGPVAQLVAWCSLAAVGCAGLVGALLPGRAAAAGPAVLVVAGLLGLPHGAVDHLALGWARGHVGRPRPAVLVGYALAAVAAAAVALAAPLPALVVLLALSIGHFAEGEAAFARLRGGQGLVAPALALGAAVVVLPIELRPSQARPLLLALDDGLPAVLAGVRGPLLGLTAVLVAAGLGAALRSGQLRVAGELVVVVAAALLAPPLLVFAVWFAGWHGPRHLVRLAALEPSGDGRQRLRRLAAGAAVPTAVAVVGLVGLALALGGLPGAVLVVLLALTVPHAAVVAQLDRLGRRGSPGRRTAPAGGSPRPAGPAGPAGPARPTMTRAGREVRSTPPGSAG